MALTILSQGNLFKTPCDALVNPVNCQGVMGKGVALCVKIAYPEVYAAYRNYCVTGLMLPGHVLPIKTDYNSPKWVLCFATKDGWRQPSNLTWIDQGLDRLVHLVAELGIKRVAMPAIGCGLGGLRWEGVKTLLEKHLTDSNVEFLVFEPR